MPRGVAPRKITSEQAREMAKISAMKRRQKGVARKKMKEELEILLRTTRKKRGRIMTPEEIRGVADAQNINCDMQTSILLAVLRRAELGDMQAVQFIRDTLGEKPSDKVQVDNSVTIENYAKTHKLKI